MPFQPAGVRPRRVRFGDLANLAGYRLVTRVWSLASRASVLRSGPTVRLGGRGPCSRYHRRASFAVIFLLAQLIASGGASSVTVAAPTQFKLDRAAALGVNDTVLIQS